MFVIRSFSVLPLLAVAALAACQPTASSRSFAYGEEQVAACIAARCSDLTLDYAPLADYRALAGLDHVAALMLGYTDFADIDDIAAMTQLRELHVGNTQVRDLSGIAAFGQLELLHIQNVEPSDWAPLAALESLRELAIGHPGMRDLSMVAYVPGLRRLHLAHAGEQTDLSGLGTHPGLRSVHISSDFVADLGPLLRLPALREVSIEAFDETRHADVIAQLRARGVRVSLTEPVILVC